MAGSFWGVDHWQRQAVLFSFPPQKIESDVLPRRGSNLFFCTWAVHQYLCTKATRHYMWQTHKPRVARADSKGFDIFPHFSWFSFAAQMCVCSPAQTRLHLKEAYWTRCVTAELLLSLPAESISKQFYPSQKSYARASCDTSDFTHADPWMNSQMLQRIYKTVPKGDEAPSAVLDITLQTDVK